MARIKLEDVRKVYENGVVAVCDVAFEVEDGAFVVLVGPSGCGKTTLLRVIAGLESATQGALYIDGQPANGVPPKDRDVAMVFQNYALYPHMTVFGNMAFGLKLRKYPKEETRKRVEEAASVLGLTDVLNRKPSQLSGGQQQRVALGRAIVRKPRVFLFDEPLSNLDAKLRVQTRTEIARLHRRLGATMIYVTHDQTEAMTMGDRIVVLREGRVQQIDPPMRLYRHPANQFVAGFIGSPSMNLVPGCLGKEDERWHFEAQRKAFTLPLRGRPAPDVQQGDAVVLGIRPEDLYVAAGLPVPRSSAVVEATLDVVEPVGSETVLYSQAGPHTLVARLAPQPLPDAGQPVRLVVDLAKLYFFDAATGNALGRHAAEAVR